MHQRGLHDLMIILSLLLILCPLQAQIAVNALAVEVLRSVQSHQILTWVELKGFQSLTALKPPKVLAEHPLQGTVVVLIQDLAKLRVCRNCLYPEDGAQIIALDLILKTSLKLQ
jgi:hypothetical protein